MLFKYREIIREIIFVFGSGRSDISYAVIEISHFSYNPEECHYVAINRVVRYLRQDP